MTKNNLIIIIRRTTTTITTVNISRQLIQGMLKILTEYGSDKPIKIIYRI
jgi:hypothetical protein